MNLHCRIPVFFLLLLIFPVSLAAQSVVVRPRTVTYKRPKPLMDEKKTFTITYPKVSGLTPNLNRKVETAISYERAANVNVKEEISEYQWLEQADYHVDYNRNAVLVVTLNVSGSAAYPSEYSKTVVVDLKTGMRVRPADIFTDQVGLVAKLRRIQQAEIRNSLAEIKKNELDAEDPGSLFRETNFTAKDLSEFSVSDKGVTFIYDYGFPHVIQALQPAGRYFLAWPAIKPFMKQHSLLARLVR
jgi:hypothetical protein